jgi:hypothetical protein
MSLRPRAVVIVAIIGQPAFVILVVAAARERDRIGEGPLAAATSSSCLVAARCRDLCTSTEHPLFALARLPQPRSPAAPDSWSSTTLP